MEFRVLGIWEFRILRRQTHKMLQIYQYYYGYHVVVMIFYWFSFWWVFFFFFGWWGMFGSTGV
jgi:hypothetical protein